MENKIKNRFKLNVMLPAIIIYISFAISAVMGGISLGIYVLGIAMIILSFFVFYQYLRTKHFGSLISTIYLVIFGSFCISIHPYYEIGERLHMTQTSAILFVFAMILLVWLVYLNVTRKLKWRGRELLELAAQNITDTYNNHTERPLPTGNVDFSREELYNFSKFFEKNLLGLTYKEDDIWFRLFVLHVYHAGAGNVSAVIDKIAPESGSMDIITEMWQNTAASFGNNSQNYSQLALASQLILHDIVYANSDYVLKCVE